MAKSGGGSSGGGKASSRNTPRAGGPERRIVGPHPDGGWQVRAPGAERASARTDTQSEAAQRAEQIVQNLGGGEVTIQGRDGRIRNSNTVPPGNDPFPPRDTKH
jgi:hypothetical protein